MSQTEAVRQYWSGRAEGYSLRNLDEITGGEAERLQALFEKTLALSKGAAVLDVGCGPGIFSLVLARMGCRVTGADLTPAMLEEARANAAKLGLSADFVEADAARLPFPDGTFDAVVSRWLVWNLPDPALAYKEWLRVLKPGGRLLVKDGNHYRHLSDPNYAALCAAREQPAGHAPKYMKGSDPQVMEEIARTLPLSDKARPEWDRSVLAAAGCTVETPEEKTEVVPGTDVRLVTEFVITARKPV